MRDILKNKFKNIELYNKAEEMTSIMKEIKIKKADYIVSGLPFTVLDKKIREEILNQVYENLKEQGKFITYQYSLDLYKYLNKKYKKLEVKFVPLNIPMAFIYICTK